MKKLILFLMTFGVTLVVGAQDFNHYQPLQCSGTIPADFITPSSKKYKSEIKKIASADYNTQEKKDRENFALESSFVLDDLLQSGIVLFNDPVTLYLNEVCGQLTKWTPPNKPIRVYALRSTAVNAFATEQGAIFVTLGLLAQLENEAQLAYIIAHEIIHVLEGHPIDLFLEAQSIERNSTQRSVLGTTTFDDKILAKNRYSKELETAADTKGLDLMLKTDYSTATLNTVFDVLKYSYLPFDEVAFERSFFETVDFKFPDGYWLNTVNAIQGEDEFPDDSKSDHPNIGQRRLALAQALKNNAGAGTKNFVLAEERFFTAQKIARFELPLLHLRHGELSDAIYTAYLLEREAPSLYLQKCLLKSLYLHAKYLNDGDYSFEVKIDSIEGEIQRVFKFLQSLDQKEATVFALQKAWKLHQQHPEDQETKLMLDDLFVEMAQHFKNLDFFLLKTTAIEPESPKIDTTTNTSKTKMRSKFDRIKEKQQQQPEVKKSNFLNTAFDEFIKDAAFKAAFEQGQKAYNERIAAEENHLADWKKNQRKESLRGANLGIPKIVVVNPFYLKLNEKKDNPVLYIDTENGQNSFRGLMQEVATKSGLKTVFLDVENLKESQADRFNDIRDLNEWFSEQVQFSDLSLTPGIQQEKINGIASKYDTDYFLWTGAISLLPKGHNAVQPLFGGLIFWPQLPWAIANAVKPKYDLLYFAILFDVKTMKRRVIKFEYFRYSDFTSVVKAHGYDAFLQIKQKD